jgi:DNA processing protein
MDKDDYKEMLHWIALAMIPGIGGITARKLLERTGSPQAVFREKRNVLIKIPGIGSNLADRITQGQALRQAHDELEYIIAENISAICYGDADYPSRLVQCYDAPLVIYTKGSARYNEEKVVGIVGTRRPSDYGIAMCKKLVQDLKERGHECLVVSGLAYGIDHIAHQSALKQGLETVAVLGHGLRFMYPALHRNTAARIIRQGALVTDFSSRQKPEPNNFIRRNRIIAGLSDAVIVVESGTRGGALITADLANSYDREVFAFPGKSGDDVSAGCNGLIKSNKAAMIENCEDLEYFMNWEPSRSTGNGKDSNRVLSDQERCIVQVLKNGGEISVDMICLHSGLHVKTVSGLLLNLEFMGLIACLPGNRYRLV